MVQRFFAASVAICLGLAFVSGCGQESVNGRYAISGSVTFQGQPLDQGSIEFIPEGGEAAAGGAMIKEGAYRVPASHGLRPGAYRVRIYASDASSAAPATEFPGMSTTVAKERIPAAYNRESTLTATVTEDGANKFDFSIP